MEANPKKLGSYEIVRQLGEGSYGKVFLGIHSILGRETAVKLFKTERISPVQLDGFLENFIREARILAALNSQYIVQIYDVFPSELGPCIAMEYVDGCSLDKLDFAKMSEQEKVSCLTCVLKGMEIAHQRGIVHRDLKPGNLLLNSDMKKVKITDFGISLQLSEQTEEDMQKILGTWYYMSPEQIQKKRQDCRCDIWALGVIFYKIFTGRLPFAGKTKAHIKKNICRGQYLPPSEIAQVPSWLDSVVAGCLQIKPAERYKHCKEILKILPGNKGGLRLAEKQFKEEAVVGQLVSALLEEGGRGEKTLIMQKTAQSLGVKKAEKKISEELEEAMNNALKKKIIFQYPGEVIAVKKGLK